MTVIVTGAQGFLGSRLCELWDENEELIRIDTTPSHRHNHHCLDLCDFHALADLVYWINPRLIIHLAAFSHVIRNDVHLKQSPHEILGKNVLATYNVLQVVNCNPNPCRVIMAGSAAEYGDCSLDHEPLTEYDTCMPLEAYGISKHICTMLGQDMGFVKTLRFANIYGPNQRGKFIPLLIEKALTGQQLVLHGKGLQLRQWLYVDDAVDAIKKAVACLDPDLDIVNIAPQEEVSIRDLTVMIYQALQDQALKLRFELPIMDLQLQEDGGGARRVSINAHKAYSKLGWRQKVSLEEGIRRTVQAALIERMKGENSKIKYHTGRAYLTSNNLP